MGRYVDWSDVTNVYPSLAKDKGAEVGARFIADAEGEVDARLAPRYAVPFVPGSSNVPQIVRTLSIDLAFYRCDWRQKGMKDMKEYIDERFEALLAGSMSLVTSGGAIATSDVRAWTDRTNRSSFGVDAPENWSVSADWQTSQEDERSGD